MNVNVTKLLLFKCFDVPAGKLPEGNNVSWQGDSCLNDGKFPGSSYPHFAGGYYDAGGSIKSNFPMSFLFERETVLKR